MPYSCFWEIPFFSLTRAESTFAISSWFTSEHTTSLQIYPQVLHTILQVLWYTLLVTNWDQFVLQLTAVSTGSCSGIAYIDTGKPSEGPDSSFRVMGVDSIQFFWPRYLPKIQWDRNSSSNGDSSNTLIKRVQLPEKFCASKGIHCFRKKNKPKKKKRKKEKWHF